MAMHSSASLHVPQVVLLRVAVAVERNEGDLSLADLVGEHPGHVALKRRLDHPGARRDTRTATIMIGRRAWRRPLLL